jgi:hypothetical protein
MACTFYQQIWQLRCRIIQSLYCLLPAKVCCQPGRHTCGHMGLLEKVPERQSIYPQPPDYNNNRLWGEGAGGRLAGLRLDLEIILSVWSQNEDISENCALQHRLTAWGVQAGERRPQSVPGTAVRVGHGMAGPSDALGSP